MSRLGPSLSAGNGRQQSYMTPVIGEPLSLACALMEAGDPDRAVRLGTVSHGSNIRQLTDVSNCIVQHHFLCSRDRALQPGPSRAQPRTVASDLPVQFDRRNP